MKIQDVEKTCVIAVFSLEFHSLNRDVHFTYNHRLEALNRLSAQHSKKSRCVFFVRATVDLKSY